MSGDLSVDLTTAVSQIEKRFFGKSTTSTGSSRSGTSQSAGETSYTGETRSSPLTDSEVIEKASSAKNGDKFKALYVGGDLSAYGNDASKADAAMARILAYYLWQDPERIERVMRLSALLRDKWDEHPTYMSRTIAAVLNSMGSDPKNYWSRDGKSKSQDEQATESAGTSEPPFKIQTFEEFESAPPPPYQVAGIIQMYCLCLIIAAFAAFKSFLGLDIALSVATGQPWQGFATQQGTVLYVVAEGRGAFVKRVKAWMKHRGIDSIPNFFVLADQPRLNAEADLKPLITAVKAMTTPPALIILDTLARTFEGNENTQEDMGRYVRAASQLQAMGATVIVIHHTGKNGEYRGSSALPGAADTIIRMDRKGDSVRVKNEKQKDDAEFDSFNLKKVVIQLSDPPSDPDVIELKPETSLVFVRDNSKSGTADDLTPAQVQVLQVLFDSDDGLTHSEWLKATELESRTRTFADALKSLKDHDFLTQTSPRRKGNTYRVSDSGRAYLESTGDGESDEN